MTNLVNVQHEALKRKSLQKIASLTNVIDFDRNQFKGPVFFFDIISGRRLSEDKNLNSYCIVHWDGVEMPTSIVWKSDAPSWKENYMFPVTEQSNGTLVVTVHSKNANPLHKGDEFLDVSLEEEIIKKWVQLDGKLGVKNEALGQILLKFQFFASDLGKMHRLNEQIDLVETYEDFREYFFKLKPQHFALLFDHNKFVPTPDEIHSLTHILIDNPEIVPTKVLQFIIYGEVKGCLSTGTLFRRNSLASKFVTSCMNRFGQEYLIKYLRPIVEEILTQNQHLEVDPDKTEADVTQNMQTILSYVERILTTVLDSVDSMPYEVRETCSILLKEVHEKYNDEKVERLAVGGCVWLRFICPALTNPSDFLVPGATPHKDTLRTLILVSKVLQNLSNAASFAKKEQFMIPANDFLTKWQEKMNACLHKISDLSGVVATTTLDSQIKKIGLTDAIKMSKEDLKMYWGWYLLHHYFDRNIKEIKEGCDKSPPEFSLPIDNIDEFRVACSGLEELLTKMGKPHQIQLIPNKEEEKKKELQDKKDRKVSMLKKVVKE